MSMPAPPNAMLKSRFICNIGFLARAAEYCWSVTPVATEMVNPTTMMIQGSASPNTHRRMLGTAMFTADVIGMGEAYPQRLLRTTPERPLRGRFRNVRFRPSSGLIRRSVGFPLHLQRAGETHLPLRKRDLHPVFAEQVPDLLEHVGADVA